MCTDILVSIVPIQQLQIVLQTAEMLLLSEFFCDESLETSD